MLAAFETIDYLRGVQDCGADIDEYYTAIMRPCWKNYPQPGQPTGRFMEWRRYEKTNETHEGYPLYREVREEPPAPLSDSKNRD